MAMGLYWTGPGTQVSHLGWVLYRSKAIVCRGAQYLKIHPTLTEGKEMLSVPWDIVPGCSKRVPAC